MSETPQGPGWIVERRLNGQTTVTPVVLGPPQPVTYEINSTYALECELDDLLEEFKYAGVSEEVLENVSQALVTALRAAKASNR